MICPHCSEPVRRAPLEEYPASMQQCSACGVGTFVEGEGFTARSEHIEPGVIRYSCRRCGHVRDVTIPADN